ncbi:MAG: hypothetical protein IJ325_09545 [Clostridia bacterium]|nr:hypothetical protein [Clostridia bacterium]
MQKIVLCKAGIYNNAERIQPEAPIDLSAENSLKGRKLPTTEYAGSAGLCFCGEPAEIEKTDSIRKISCSG